MASVDTLQSEFVTLETAWADLRPFLVQYLPHDGKLSKADHLFAEAKRFLERAIRADEKRQKPLALWWYVFALARTREHRQLAEALGECGLQAQEAAKRQRKATA